MEQPPFTTPAMDVRNLDGFMLNTERLLASELWATSTGEEFKAAVGLWCRAWKQLPAGSLPDDDRVLAAFAGVTAARWKKVKAMALRGFVRCTDGRLYHRTLCLDVVRAHERVAAFRDRAQAAAQARWKHPLSNAPSIPQASPKQCLAMPRDGTGTGTGTGREGGGGGPPPPPPHPPWIHTLRTSRRDRRHASSESERATRCDSRQS